MAVIDDGATRAEGETRIQISFVHYLVDLYRDMRLLSWKVCLLGGGRSIGQQRRVFPSSIQFTCNIQLNDAPLIW